VEATELRFSCQTSLWSAWIQSIPDIFSKQPAISLRLQRFKVVKSNINFGNPMLKVR
jgi:hypothetical protein